MALLPTLINLPPTCGEICLQVLDQTVAKKLFLLSKPMSGYGAGVYIEKIILAGPATRRP